MAWRAVEVRKVGDLVSWYVNGALLIDVDTTDFVEPLTGNNILFGHSDINAGSSGDALSIDLLFTLIDNVSVTDFTTSGLMCDADADGDCQIDDLDAMYDLDGSAGAFDYDSSGTIDNGDLSGWLAEASTAANGANPDALTYVVGDVNLSGNVDSTDLGLLLNSFGTTAGTAGDGPGWGGGDLNMNGAVDSADLGLLLNGFGFTSTVASAVPEPNAITLLLVAMLSMVGLARRSRK